MEPEHFLQDVQTLIERRDFFRAARLLHERPDADEALASKTLLTMDSQMLGDERRDVLALFFCGGPRPVWLERSFMRSGLWISWRQELPRKFACTFLTLFHPATMPLKCDECGSEFSTSHGVVGPTKTLCRNCTVKASERIAFQCAACEADSAAGFCLDCFPQVEALLLRG